MTALSILLPEPYTSEWYAAQDMRRRGQELIEKRRAVTGRPDAFAADLATYGGAFTRLAELGWTPAYYDQIVDLADQANQIGGFLGRLHHRRSRLEQALSWTQAVEDAAHKGAPFDEVLDWLLLAAHQTDRDRAYSLGAAVEKWDSDIAAWSVRAPGDAGRLAHLAGISSAEFPAGDISEATLDGWRVLAALRGWDLPAT